MFLKEKNKRDKFPEARARTLRCFEWCRILAPLGLFQERVFLLYPDRGNKEFCGCSTVRNFLVVGNNLLVLREDKCRLQLFLSCIL